MIIKCKFLKDGTPQGRDYTYFSNSDVSVGDTVQINEKAKGVVTEIDVAESEIQAFKGAVKTIDGKISIYYFTFCGNQEHAGHYVKISGTYFSARQEMHNRFGEKWGFQYEEQEWKRWEVDAKAHNLPIETELVEKE